VVCVCAWCYLLWVLLNGGCGYWHGDICCG
jgi:hypothetical protein